VAGICDNPNMDSKKWLFVFAALSGVGGLAGFLVWLDIKPKDLWWWHVSLVIPHWLWLALGLLLFAFSIGLSISVFFRKTIELKELKSDTIVLREELAKAKAEASGLASKVALLPSESKLKIHRAIYGAGGPTNVDITEKLQMADRDALFIPVDNNLVPKDPCPGVRKWLSVEYSYGDGVVLFAKRPESMPGDIVRLVLPEYKDERDAAQLALLQQAFAETNKRADEFQKKFAVCENDKRRLEEKINEAARQEPTLRLRIIKTCDDLADFLLEHGSKPKVSREIGEVEASFVGRQAMSTLAWKDKMGADFRLRFGQSVPRLRDEIRIRSAFSENDLDNAIAKAESQYCDTDAVDTIRWKFWSLAGKMTA
jgi:hypothetical protein